MPALYRTVNQNVNLPNKRPWFIGGVIARRAAVHRRHLGAGRRDRRLRGPDRDDRRLRLPALVLFIRGQRGKQAARTSPTARWPRRSLLGGADRRRLRAAARAQPVASSWRSRSAAVALWMVLLGPLRAIPPAALAPADPHGALVPARHPGRLPARARACAASTPRPARRAARRGRRAPAARAPRPRGERPGRAPGRRAAQGRQPRRGPESAARPAATPRSPSFLFEDASTAVRDASMRALLDRGVDANDLRALEDLAKTLARLPVEAWEGKPATRGHAAGAGGRRRSCASARPAAPRARAQSSSSSPAASSPPLADAPPERRITIRSGSTVTSTWRWPAQCSA